MKNFFIKTLEKAANYYLKLDSHSFTRITALKGKMLLIEVIGFGQVCCLLTEAGLHFTEQSDQSVDAVIRGKPGALFGAMRAKNSADMLQEGKLEISGDIELGQTISLILREISIDWEEQTARWVCDVPARKLGNIVRTLHRFATRAGESVRQNITEYFQEESRQLPTRLEVADFITEVNALRHAVDRLEARINLLG